MLFADDAAVAIHTQQELQILKDCFSQACKDFGLSISLKKAEALGLGEELVVNQLTRVKQGKRQNAFHLRCIRRILGIT
ncbi:hypothetical protein ACOMHN_054487 [Nucella lapillus]